MATERGVLQREPALVGYEHARPRAQKAAAVILLQRELAASALAVPGTDGRPKLRNLQGNQRQPPG